MREFLFLPILFLGLISINPLVSETNKCETETYINNLEARKFFENDFEIRNGIYYLKNSLNPYTGKIIHEKNDFITESGELKNGKKIGLWIDTYNDSGILERKREYKNGAIKDGLRKNYHWNGRLWNRINYTNGKMNGLWEEFHDNGLPSMRVIMIDGEANGIWEVFNKDGSLYYSINYKNGSPVDGLKKFYRKNGEVKFEGNFLNGERDGAWRFFKDDNSLEKTIIYKEGKNIFQIIH